MIESLAQTGNASSVHAEGRRARAMLEHARDQLAEAIGACRDDLTFTGGGTEALAAAVQGAMQAQSELELVVSGIEHDAVAGLAASASVWPTQANGVVDLDWLSERVAAISEAGRIPFVSLMLVNNETGVIQPVLEAARITHAAGGLIHCDAIQALGKMPVSVVDLEVNYLSVSSHKIGGPQGVGAFYVRPGASFRAIQVGGGQELGRRGGTENVAGIVGFGAACEAASAGLATIEALAETRDAMEARLKAAVPGLIVHGVGARRVSTVSCFGVEGLLSETQIMGLDLAGFAVSAGSACSSGKVKPSRVLTAMGVSESAARSSIRASFGWASKVEDFDALADAWLAMVKRARPELVSTAIEGV